MNFLKFFFLLSFLFFFHTVSFAQDANRYQNEVDLIVDKEFHIDPSKPIAVFTGSSSIRMWRNVDEVFPSINAINTGFGGSQFTDLIHFQNELIYEFNPDQVFIYEGDNDISEGKSPASILIDAENILQQIREKLPEADIYFISPKPSIARWNLKKEYETLNGLLKELTEQHEQTYFINVWDPMLNDSGTPMDDIFISDNLHMNEKGYVIWTKVIGRAAGLLN
ncbi:MAG: GDSL-type esterase/lipase family protein [Balneolaceae bacterium]